MFLAATTEVIEVSRAAERQRSEAVQSGESRGRAERAVYRANVAEAAIYPAFVTDWGCLVASALLGKLLCIRRSGSTGEPGETIPAEIDSSCEVWALRLR